MKIKGTKKSEYITGSFDDDVIRGRKGHDVILANGGDDVLFGGKGKDTFILSPDSFAVLADFEPGKDTVVIDDRMVTPPRDLADPDFTKPFLSYNDQPIAFSARPIDDGDVVLGFLP